MDSHPVPVLLVVCVFGFAVIRATGVSRLYAVFETRAIRTITRAIPYINILPLCFCPIAQYVYFFGNWVALRSGSKRTVCRYPHILPASLYLTFVDMTYYCLYFEYSRISIISNFASGSLF